MIEWHTPLREMRCMYGAWPRRTYRVARRNLRWALRTLSLPYHGEEIYLQSAGCPHYSNLEKRSPMARLHPTWRCPDCMGL
jgi:hypothetical protein